MRGATARSSAPGGTDAPDVVAARSPALTRFFTRMLRRRTGRAFHAVRVAKPGAPAIPEGRAAIVYANHPSWWDPALFLLLADALFPDREIYGPIEAAQLERYRFMRRIGVFGATPGPAGAAAFLRTAAAILADPRRMLWITPEGTFRDPRARPLRFRSGLARLMADMPDAVAIPLALDYPFWSESRPEALARFGAPVPGGPGAEDWRARLEGALTETMDRLAEDAMARDPARFETLLRGGAGVGGVYDGWRRLRAGLRGERFRPEHDAGVERAPEAPRKAESV